METIFSESVVIGGGVVGLSVARELALKKSKVIILEKEPCNGSETSSRNSGVIHSGIYYPQNSLKSQFCVDGNRLLYQYALDRKIAFQNTGKIVIASSSDEVSNLENLYKNGHINGVSGLELLTQAEITKNYVEDLTVVAGLYCPSSGIIDAHDLIMALESDLQSLGVIMSNNTFVNNIHSNSSGGYEVEVKSKESFFNIKCDVLINCGGLHATEVAKKIDKMQADKIPTTHFAKGHYFSFTGDHPFKDLLIYPLPSKDSLGIHVSPDTSGKIRFGPDLNWIENLDYSFQENIKEKFYVSIKKYWPGIDRQKLHPDYTGIRPKIYGPSEKAVDFKIQTSDDHGLHGLINLFGIESPGLTSSLAIGKYVSEKALK